MQHKKFVALSAGLTAGIVIITAIYANDILNAEPYESYAFSVSSLVTLLVAVLLGYYFWHLQKQDTNKMQAILDNLNALTTEQAKIIQWVDEVVKITADMAAEERVRKAKRKQFWVKEAISQLALTKSDLRNLQAYYDVILKESPNEQRLNEIAELIKSDRFRMLNDTAVRMNAAISQIADLLDDNSLFRDVKSSDFTWFLETADTRMSSQKMHTAMEMIEVAKENIDSLIKRLEKEKPSNL